MMNSTRYMNGVGANDTLWSTAQGMGMMNLGTAFDGVSRATRDQVPAERFTGSGQIRVYSGTISDPTKPFRVTLAWTDAPGATSGNAYVNNLDLQVIVGGSTYLGNVFSGSNSTTGGVADPRNNVESVFLPAGLSGNFSIIVPATNIAGQADPTVAGNNQDFALVAYNSGPLAPLTDPVLAVGSNTVTTGNGIIEPNECNALTSIINNAGLGGATAVSSVLSTTTPGVVIAQQNSAYPDLAAGGSGANLSAFQISTGPAVACGSTINLAHTVTYAGGGSPATLNFTLPVGQPAATQLRVHVVVGDHSGRRHADSGHAGRRRGRDGRRAVHLLGVRHDGDCRQQHHRQHQRQHPARAERRQQRIWQRRAAVGRRVPGGGADADAVLG